MMKARTVLSGCFVVLIVGMAAGQPKKIAPARNNQELMQLFMDDQHDRGNDPFIEYDDNGKRLTPEKEWKILPDGEMAKHDLARQKRVRQMLAAGTVRTGEDYNIASFIFQHGEGPDDYLLAHVLAVVAVSKGSKDARWVAAATLDRYLQSLKQPQVFGTQFPYNSTGGISQGDYKTDLISNRVRAALCVKPREKQEEQLQEARKKNGKADFNTGLIPCP